MDVIQKTIDAMAKLIDQVQDTGEFDELAADDLHEAMSALRDMKAVDVGELKREMDRELRCMIPHSYSYNTMCVTLDHLKSKGYVFMKAVV